MDGDRYHHGDLRQQLIDNGLLLLNSEGVEEFSLRKVARMCGVSHTAPYKHFKDKEALIDEIVKEVWKKFYLSLAEISKLHINNARLQLIEMGKAYVKFMIDNPNYLKFMYLSDNNCSVTIKNGKFLVEDDSFKLFKGISQNYLSEINLEEKCYKEKILAMWGLIHGLTILITQKSIRYDGEYSKLVEEILQSVL